MSNQSVSPVDTIATPSDGPISGIHGYTVSDLCRRWKIGPDKVRAFLRRGELIGVNVAMSLCARPQWRITPESVSLFEKRRTSAPLPKLQRKRPRIEEETDFYPD